MKHVLNCLRVAPFVYLWDERRFLSSSSLLPFSPDLAWRALETDGWAIGGHNSGKAVKGFKEEYEFMISGRSDGTVLFAVTCLYSGLLEGIMEEYTVISVSAHLNLAGWKTQLVPGPVCRSVIAEPRSLHDERARIRVGKGGHRLVVECREGWRGLDTLANTMLGPGYMSLTPRPMVHL